MTSGEPDDGAIERVQRGGREGPSVRSSALADRKGADARRRRTNPAPRQCVGGHRSLFRQVNDDRRKVTASNTSTLIAVRPVDLLPTHPMVTLLRCTELLRTSKPTAVKAIDTLRKVGVLDEITGELRDRVYAYKAYLDVLAKDTAIVR